MSIYFTDLKWPEVEKIREKNPVIILPVGMIEEHGHHLPISCDTDIASYTARTVAEKIKDEIPVLLMPAIWTGYHGKPVSDFPGSIRLEAETFKNLVYDIVASLCRNAFSKILIINGHGHNPCILELVCREIGDKFDVYPILTNVWNMIGKEGARYRKSKQGGMAGHGDEQETAMMLAINEDLVDMSKALDESATFQNKFVAGDTFPEHEVIKVYWSSWALQGTRTGLLGDAAAATKDTGEKLFELVIRNYCDLIKLYYNHKYINHKYSNYK